MDRWLFPAVALGPGFAGGGTAKSFTLTLTGVAGAGELALRLYSPYAMEHAAAVALNSVSLGSVTWSGSRVHGSALYRVSLLEGANTVAVTCESGADKIYFDWFEADYERSFASAADSLKFTHAEGFRYTISGFSTNDVELFEISDAAAVKRVVNGTTSGSGPYAIEVQPAQAAGSASYLAVAAAGTQDAGSDRQGYGLTACRFDERSGLDPDHAPGDRLGERRGTAELGGESRGVAPGPGAAHGGGGCGRHLR